MGGSGLSFIIKGFPNSITFVERLGMLTIIVPLQAQQILC